MRLRCWPPRPPSSIGNKRLTPDPFPVGEGAGVRSIARSSDDKEDSNMARSVETLTRREMLNRSFALSALAAAQVAWPSWMPRLAFAPKTRAPRGDVLICIFLRGGADGLNIIVPHGENAYYNARPAINIARPDDSKADITNKA